MEQKSDTENDSGNRHAYCGHTPSASDAEHSRIASGKAVKANQLDTNPAARVENLDRTDKHRRRAFTLPELKKLLAVAGEEWPTMILVGIYTGLRLGDIASLTWANVDLETE